MILDVARVVNVSFGVIVGACFVGGIIAGLFAGSVESETAEVDVPDWHED
jgi:fructose-specific phosphotransferase system IIC component